MPRWTPGALAAAALCLGCQKPIELLWAFQSGAGSRSSPALVKDMVLFGNEAGYLNAVDRNDGSSRWRFPTTKEVVAAPVADGTRAYFGSENYSFYALELHSGRAVWEFPTHDRIKGGAALAGGVVYFGSYDGHLYALRAEDRGLVWQFPAAAPGPLAGVAAVAVATDTGGVVPAALPAPPKAFSYARPAIGEGLVFAGNLDGLLYALDQKTGALRWSFKTGDGITSSPLLEGGTLYFGSNDHRVYALTGLSGAAPTVKWSFATGDQVNASPLLAGGVVYVGGSDKVFYAIDATSGKKLWQQAVGGPVYARAALYQNLVFVGAGAGDGRLYAFDAKSGKPFWTYETGTKVQADLLIDADRLYAVTGDGQLLAFQIHKTTQG
jgi:eukaryotic-like serine/threonine-protein kinase